MNKASVAYCNRCSLKNTCGFVVRGLEMKCTELSTYMDGYEHALIDAYNAVKARIDTYKNTLAVASDVMEEALEIIKNINDE